MSKYGKSVYIVPCGLNYFSGHRFRGNSLLEFGKAFKIPMTFAEQYKQNQRAACDALLGIIKQHMDVVITQAPVRDSILHSTGLTFLGPWNFSNSQSYETSLSTIWSQVRSFRNASCHLTCLDWRLISGLYYIIVSWKASTNTRIIPPFNNIWKNWESTNLIWKYLAFKTDTYVNTEITITWKPMEL